MKFKILFTFLLKAAAFLRKITVTAWKNMIHYAQITLKINFKLLWCKMYLCSLLLLFSLLWFTVCTAEIYWIYFILCKKCLTFIFTPYGESSGGFFGVLFSFIRLGYLLHANLNCIFLHSFLCDESDAIKRV